MLKVIDGGKSEFNENEKALYKNIQTMLEQYGMLEEYGTGDRDFSKYYLVMAYNLFELNLEQEALEVMEKVTSKYWHDEFLNDAQEAVDYRNGAEILKMNGDEDTEEYKDAKIQSEFFIIAATIGEHLRDREFSSKGAYVTTDKIFEETDYTFIVTEEIKNAVENMEEQEDE